MSTTPRGLPGSWPKLSLLSMWISVLHFISAASFPRLFRFGFTTIARLSYGWSNLASGQADLLQLPFVEGTIHSISCMHVVEHLGLGALRRCPRPQGDQKAMRELARVLAPGGVLLFVVPVGRTRLRFNAHRVYGFRQIRESFRGLELKEFSLIPDDPAHGGLIKNPSEEVVDSQNYGCGCFWFVRPT